MNAAVIGVGHVGLVTAVCLSDFGLVVTCADKNSTTIDLLQRGGSPFFEPGVAALVRKNVHDPIANGNALNTRQSTRYLLHRPLRCGTASRLPSGSHRMVRVPKS